MKVTTTFTFETPGPLLTSSDFEMLGEAVNGFADSLRDRGDNPVRQTLTTHIDIQGDPT